MERRLFDAETPIRGGRRAITLPVSLAVHAAVVAGALILPLLGDDVLPEVSAAQRVFFAEPAMAPPPPPPPAAPSNPVRVTATARPQVAGPSALVAPVSIPDTIPDEPIGADPFGTDPNGVVGGDPNAPPMGVIVGGLPKTPTITNPIPVSRGVREPRKLRHVAPIYPELARKIRLQGTVVVECTIDTQGRVVNATVVNGNPLLNEAALAAVQQWVYTPTLLSGVPVPVLLHASVTFTLQ
jgi:protein TonB